MVAINLEVTWIAVRRSVRSPVAAVPKRNWSDKMCLPSVRLALRSVAATRTDVGYLVRVMISVLGIPSSAMVDIALLV